MSASTNSYYLCCMGSSCMMTYYSWTPNHSLLILPVPLVSCPLTPSHHCVSSSPLISCFCASHSFCCVHPSCNGCMRNACISPWTRVSALHAFSHCVSSPTCLGFCQTLFFSYHWILLHTQLSCVLTIHTCNSIFLCRYSHACSGFPP